MRKNARRKNARVIKRITKNDRVVTWERSGARRKWLALKTWMGLPDSLTVREILVRVPYPGFTTQTILVVTTLLDPKKYPAANLAEPYWRRWNVELFCRDIQIALGMETSFPAAHPA